MLTGGEPLLDLTHYRHFIGQPVYLYISRPNIAHIISIVSQIVNVPQSDKYANLLQIMKYVRGIVTPSLMFPADADWV